MIFNEILEKFKAEDPQDLMDALEELNQASHSAAAEAQQALKAYYANAQEKEEKVTSRIHELKNQLTGDQAKIDAFKRPLISATAAGDQKKLAEIKDGMKALEADKTQILTEIEMLESAHVSGDEDLYNEVLKKVAVHDELCKVYLSAKQEVYSLAGKKQDAYEKLSNATQYLRSGGGYRVNTEALNKHFRFEEYKKLEDATAKERAEQEAEAERRRNTSILADVSRPQVMGGGPR